MTALIAFWTFSDGVYTPDKSARVMRMKIGGTMILWYFIKSCHDRFVIETDPLPRFSWYAYYIAITLLPLLCCEFSEYFSSSGEKKNKKKFVVFYIIAALLILLTLTNDLHELTFSFPGNDYLNWTEDYSRGIGYYLIVAFELLMFGLTIKNVWKQCTLPKSKKYIALPLLPLIMMLVYIVLNVTGLDPHVFNGEKNVQIFILADVFCYLIMTFADACGAVYRLATEMPDEGSFVLHRIFDEVSAKMDSADAMLDSVYEADEEAFREGVFLSGIVQTYTKRVSNLLLLGRQWGKLEFMELVLSLAESVEYLKLGGIVADLAFDGDGRFYAEDMIAVYREYEDIIEKVAPRLGAVLVVLSADGGELSLKVSAEDREGNLL